MSMIGSLSLDLRAVTRGEHRVLPADRHDSGVVFPAAVVVWLEAEGERVSMSGDLAALDATIARLQAARDALAAHLADAAQAQD